MDIKGLTYKQFSTIRKAMEEKREKIWHDRFVVPFGKTMKRWAFAEVQEAKKEFDGETNQFLEEGVVNEILHKLDDMEVEAQKEIEMIRRS
jgi:hypothetical protein